MKFIFPKNYNFKNKLFGFIDYSTIFINLIWLYPFIVVVKVQKLHIKALNDTTLN